MQELHISVRNLVEFIFRAGDIDNRAGKLASAEAMMEGSRIHRKIQKSMDTSYQAELPLKIEWKANDYVLVVEGRADGIAYGKFQPDLPAATESVLQPFPSDSYRFFSCIYIYTCYLMQFLQKIAFPITKTSIF